MEEIKEWVEEQLKTLLDVVMENNDVCSGRWEKIQNENFTKTFVSREEFEMLKKEVEQLKLELTQRESEVEEWKSERGLLMEKIETIEKAYAGVEAKLSEVKDTERFVTQSVEEKEVSLEPHVSSTLNHEVPMATGSNNGSGQHCSNNLDEGMPVLYPEVTLGNGIKNANNSHGHDTNRASSSKRHYCKCGKVFEGISELRGHLKQSENEDFQRMESAQYYRTRKIIQGNDMNNSKTTSTRRPLQKRVLRNSTDCAKLGSIRRSAPGQAVHPERPLICICGKGKFGSELKLKKHVYNSRRQKQYTCPKCPRRFPRPHILKRHQSWAQHFTSSSSVESRTRLMPETGGANVQFYCRCGKRFANKGCLKKHFNYHNQSNEKGGCAQHGPAEAPSNQEQQDDPFKPTFSTADSLPKRAIKQIVRETTPMGSASGHAADPARPLFCICGNRKFASKSTLRQHVSYSNKQKKHVCPKCFHRFSFPSQLKQHQRLRRHFTRNLDQVQRGPEEASRNRDQKEVAANSSLSSSAHSPSTINGTTEEAGSNSAVPAADSPSMSATSSGILQLNKFDDSDNLEMDESSASCTIMCRQGSLQSPLHFYFELVTEDYIELDDFNDSVSRQVEQTWLSLWVKTELDNGFQLDLEVSLLDEEGQPTQKLVELLTMTFGPGKSTRAVMEKLFMLKKKTQMQGLDSQAKPEYQVERNLKCKNGLTLNITCKNFSTLV